MKKYYRGRISNLVFVRKNSFIDTDLLGYAILGNIIIQLETRLIVKSRNSTIQSNLISHFNKYTSTDIESHKTDLFTK